MSTKHRYHEDPPSKIDDFDPFLLSAKEWAALAELHEREAWVWDRIAENDSKQMRKKSSKDSKMLGKSAKDSKMLAEYHRARYRMFKAFEAEEEQLQTEFAEERKKEQGIE